MTKLEYHILNSAPMLAIKAWLKKIVLPGFEGVSLFHTLDFFYKQLMSNRFNTTAKAISFSMLMALPPLLLFIFTLIPFLPLPEQKIVTTINDLLLLMSPPENIQIQIKKIVQNFITHKKNGLLSISVFLILFYSSNGMMNLMKSFKKKNMPGFKKRNILKQRLIAILLTLMLIVSVLSTFIIFNLHTWITKWIGLDFFHSNYYLRFVAFSIIVFMLLFTISIIYRYGAPMITRIKLFSPGAILATIMILLLTGFFFYIINNLIRYDKIYGSIGTLIIFMLWLNYVSKILIIGYELSVSIVVNKLTLDEVH
ncbi:MAG: YihY/virulence factor BrkB family protein [Chitinophagaceae bacterium]